MVKKRVLRARREAARPYCCRSCGRTLSNAQFAVNPEARRGRNSVCMDCVRELRLVRRIERLGNKDDGGGDGNGQV